MDAMVQQTTLEEVTCTRMKCANLVQQNSTTSPAASISDPSTSATAGDRAQSMSASAIPASISARTAPAGIPAIATARSASAKAFAACYLLRSSCGAKQEFN